MRYTITNRPWLLFMTGLSLVLTPSPMALAQQGQEKVEVQSAKEVKFRHTAFTYQGQLKEASDPVNGPYDFQFILYSAQTGGEKLGASEIEDVVLTDGLFKLELDFGRAVFEAKESWLEIGVRPGGSPEPYTVLTPRQKLTPTPYAIFAQHEPWSLIGVPIGFAGDRHNDTSIISLDEEKEFQVDGEASPAKPLDQAAGSAKPSATEMTPQQGPVTGGGTTGTIPLWTGATTLGDSVITQDKDGNVVIGQSEPQLSAKLSSHDSETDVDATKFYAAVLGRSKERFGVVGVSEEGSAVAGLSQEGIGVEGSSDEEAGISGESDSGPGVRGKSTSGPGVEGTSDSATGVSGKSKSGIGVSGKSDSGPGVSGTSDSFIGVDGESKSGLGVQGRSDSDTGVKGASNSGVGVFGQSESNHGVEGRSGSGSGVRGRSGSGAGVEGQSDNGPGVVGKSGGHVGVDATSVSEAGVRGLSQSGVGVAGRSTSDNGVQGESQSGRGVAGKSTSAQGVLGVSTSGFGVEGRSDSKFGVVGVSQSFPGVAGESTSAFGVQGVGKGNLAGVAGFSTSGFGVQGLSETNLGVLGQTTSGGGVLGKSTSGRGVEGQSASGIGVLGISNSNSGLQGQSTSGIGVVGISRSSRGIEGQSTEAAGVAGITMDRGKGGVVGACPEGQPCNAVVAVGDLLVGGRLLGGAKLFHIDHPLDPANKYLNHASVESPEMKNIYDGVAVLDSHGEAVVELPDWFEALNKDFRYQLTCIGGFAPVYIAEKLKNNRFKIAGGAPGLEVSWQVTGIRHDAWAKAHPMVVEEDKPDHERGYYLDPEPFGQPEEKGLLWVRYPDLMQRMKLMKQGQPAERAVPAVVAEPFK